MSLSVFALALPASAQQTINLTAIDGYPIRAMWVKENDRKINPAPFAQLAGCSTPEPNDELAVSSPQVFAPDTGRLVILATLEPRNSPPQGWT